MSLVEDVGAQVRASTDELPVANVTAGLTRLRAGLDLLRWARQESAHELGSDRLAVAAEHLENAGRALLVAQEQLGTYLTAIGLTRDGTAAPPASTGGGTSGTGQARSGSSTGDSGEQGKLADWWSTRVAVLTNSTADADKSGPTDPDELLVRVADRVRAGDRGGLAGTLGSVKAHVGLALAALAPMHAYEAASRVLGHAPSAADLPRLTSVARGRIAELLPGLPAEAIDAQLARVCRAPVQPSTTPIHPADSAVAGAVLAGVLLQESGVSGRDSTNHHEPREPGVHA